MAAIPYNHASAGARPGLDIGDQLLYEDYTRNFTSLLREGRAMKEGNELTWAQVVMAANAPVMTKAALVEGHTDVGVLPTGQVVGVIESLPTVAAIVAAVMGEADAVLRALSG